MGTVDLAKVGIQDIDIKYGELTGKLRICHNTDSYIPSVTKKASEQEIPSESVSSTANDKPSESVTDGVKETTDNKSFIKEFGLYIIIVAALVVVGIIIMFIEKKNADAEETGAESIYDEEVYKSGISRNDFLCCLACANRVSARDKDGDLVVIIDPGHGGRDSGAVQNGLTEKELNWNIAMSLKAELETYEGVKVYLTKGYGEWNSNTGRGRYGVGLGGDIFISCHNNSGSATARGSIVFTTVNSKYHDEMGKLANLILDNLNQAGFIRNGIQSRPSSGNPSADYYTALDEAAKPECQV